MIPVNQFLRKAANIRLAAISSMDADTVRDAVIELQTEKLDKTEKAVPNGLASLDSSGKVPLSQIHDDVGSPQAILNKLLQVDGDGSGLNADYLNGYSQAELVHASQVSTATDSESNTDVGSSSSVKAAYDKGAEALTAANGKLGKTEKSVDSDKLDGQDSTYYRNAGNLNAGLLPLGRLPIYKVVTSNTTASHGDMILADLSSVSEIVVKLPEEPEPGQHVTVMDAARLADQKNLTVDANGKKIMTKAESMVFDVPGYRTTLIYLNDARGWIVT